MGYHYHINRLSKMQKTEHVDVLCGILKKMEEMVNSAYYLILSSYAVLLSVG